MDVIYSPIMKNHELRAFFGRATILPVWIKGGIEFLVWSVIQTEHVRKLKNTSVVTLLHFRIDGRLHE